MIEKLVLDGAWTLEDAVGKQDIPAKVPGSVLNDLLTNGLIPDPFDGENEYAIAKLFDRDYAYRRTFSADAAFLAREHVELVCEGLDTLATICLNDREIAKTDNMHRTWRFDVKKLLRSGENELRIVFASPNQACRDAAAKYPEIDFLQMGSIMGPFALRKAHCMFGWDWGPVLPDAGIWRTIRLESRSDARIEQVQLHQAHEDGRVSVTVNTLLSEDQDGLTVTAELLAPDGSRLDRKDAPVGQPIVFAVDEPQLWYPSGLGAHPLYTVCVAVNDPDHNVADVWRRRIGLRTLTIHRQKDEWGEAFNFRCNGLDVFAMGGDYIPEDNILARVNKERTRRLLQDAVDANHNCVRVWGGGYYPDDFFFDLCDEMGLIVWLDLMFACYVYTLSDAFNESIVAEARDNLLRVRDHACLGLICGNNELEAGWCGWGWSEKYGAKLKEDYRYQFEELLAGAAKDYAPDLFYWPSSPSSGGNFDEPYDPNRGDVHYWEVWHGKKPFTDYRNYYFRFCSEFGFESFPSRKTVDTFAHGRDLNIFSRVMESHQKNGTANEKILWYMSQYLPLPEGMDNMIYGSQIMQAEAIRYGVEHWRRNRGRCMGAIYWQLNDCWPVASWSSIDSMGRWKLLHYASKRFFAPVLASCVIDGQKAGFHVTNDTRNVFQGELTVMLVDVCGKVLRREHRPVTSQPLSAEALGLIDFSAQFDQSAMHPEDSRAVCFVLTDAQGNVVSDGCELFGLPKHFELEDPCITAAVKDAGDAFEITLTAKAFAWNVWLDLKEADGHFSDNGTWLTADAPRTLTLDKATLSRPLSAEEVQAQLIVTSLYDIG